MKLGPIMILAMAAGFGLSALFLVQHNLQKPPGLNLAGDSPHALETYAKEEDSKETAVDIPSEDYESSMRAMSISISDVHGVNGFVLPGDRVDIMLTRDQYTDILLQNIKVLAIDQRADQPKSGRTATLQVNTVDAQKLTLAQTAGTLSLALRAAGSVEAAAPRRGDFPNDPLRCDYPYGHCDAFEIYSGGKEDGEREDETAVDLLAKEMEESFQAIETRINQVGQEFRGTQPIDTEAMPFDPNARAGVIRGRSRQEYSIPAPRRITMKDLGFAFEICAAARPRHPFAGRHPCFPD